MGLGTCIRGKRGSVPIVLSALGPEPQTPRRGHPGAPSGRSTHCGGFGPGRFASLPFGLLCRQITLWYAVSLCPTFVTPPEENSYRPARGV
jgi:hypothetical protein